MTKIYFVSGLGANKNILARLKLPHNYVFQPIEWEIPYPKESLTDYAKRLTKSIDIHEDFYLMGLSFGGIIVQEMNRWLNPKATIIISSVKQRKELPLRISCFRYFPIHQIIPISFFTQNKRFSYTKLRKNVLKLNDRVDIDYFFTMRNHQYLRWAAHQIIHWDKKIEVPNLYHIHGTNDLVFPHKYIKNATFVPQASHLLIYTHAKQLNHYLENILLKEVTP